MSSSVGGPLPRAPALLPCCWSAAGSGLPSLPLPARPSSGRLPFERTRRSVLPRGRAPSSSSRRPRMRPVPAPRSEPAESSCGPAAGALGSLARRLPSRSSTWFLATSDLVLVHRLPSASPSLAMPRSCHGVRRFRMRGDRLRPRGPCPPRGRGRGLCSGRPSSCKAAAVPACSTRQSAVAGSHGDSPPAGLSPGSGPAAAARPRPVLRACWPPLPHS